MTSGVKPRAEIIYHDTASTQTTLFQRKLKTKEQLAEQEHEVQECSQMRKCQMSLHACNPNSVTNLHIRNRHFKNVKGVSLFLCERRHALHKIKSQ